MAVVDGLRRVPLVRSRQHGTFCLRDIDIATGQLPPGDGDAPADEDQIKAAFASMPVDELDAAARERASAPWRRCRQHRRDDARCRGLRGDAQLRAAVGAARKNGPGAARSARVRIPDSDGGVGSAARTAVAGEAGASTSASSSRGRMRSGRWTPWPTSSGAPSRRVRFRCSWSARSGWCRRIFSKCWPTSPPTRVAQARAAGGLKEGE